MFLLYSDKIFFKGTDKRRRYKFNHLYFIIWIIVVVLVQTVFFDGLTAI